MREIILYSVLAIAASGILVSEYFWIKSSYYEARASKAKAYILEMSIIESTHVR